MTTLSADELADFWALGIPVEATCVPDDEWARALSESRVQEVSSSSSMGTAETGWVRTKDPAARRAQCAVVPPGRTATHFEWSELVDDRDTIAVCWQPLWDEQATLALRHVTEDRKEPVLAECARVLVELEQKPPPEREGATREALVECLKATTADLAQVEAALARGGGPGLAHLVRGVRARWIDRDVRAAYAAVMASAERGRRDFWGHGDVTRQAEVRRALLRFIVRLVRR